MDFTKHLLSNAKSESEPKRAYGLLKNAIVALDSVSPKRPLHAYPNPDIRHQMMLTAFDLQKWKMALQMALQGYWEIDPMIFPQETHPVRLVHKWVLLKILMHASGIYVGLVKWPLVIWKLWEEVSDEVPRSHGVESALTREIRAYGTQLTEGLVAFEASQGRYTAERLMREEWSVLKRIVDGLKVL